MLDIKMLHQLERRWRALDAPIVDHLRPGLSDAEMDSLTQPLGLRLPAEARTWWGWHDGVSKDTIQLQGERAIGYLWSYIPLGEAIAECQRCRELSDEMFEISGDREPRWWSPSWLPIVIDPPIALVCDCAVAEGEPTPIRRITPPEGQSMPEPSVTSFGALVTHWIEAIDRGIWTRKPEVGWWPIKERLPEGWRLNDVVL
jgi:hypothetical protein